MESKVEAGQILESMRQLLSVTVLPIVAYVAAMTAVYSLLDLYAAGTGNYSAGSFANAAAGYALMHSLVVKTGMASKGEVAGFGAYFGLSILQGLAYLAGLILLIVPGIILIVRWTPSFALLMSEKRGVMESMKRSWKETKGSFWPLFGVTLLGAVPALLAILMAATLFGDAVPTSATGVALSMLTNVCVTAMSAYYALLGLATYRQLFRRNEGLSEVFA